MEDCGCIFAAFVIHLKKSSCFTLYYTLYYSLHYSCCLSHSPKVISAFKISVFICRCKFVSF